jgi:hypothetical protein
MPGGGLISDLTNLANAQRGLAMDRSIGALQTAYNQVTDLTKAYDVIERRNADLAKSFNLTVIQAAKLGESMDRAAASFGIGGDAMRAITQNLKGLIGPFATLNDLATNTFGKSLIKASDMLLKNYGLTGTATNKLIQASYRAGKNADDEIAKRVAITNAIEASLGGIELTTETLTDVANLTSDIQIQYDRMPGQLELSVIKAKQLGISMSTLHSAGQNLLNIESSIGQEMEYQLLTGRRLVDNNGESLTNQYRMAELQGNSTKQADIMYEILQKEGKTLRQNMFARQKMAELMGIDEATLSTMLQKYEAIQDLPGAKDLFGLTGDALMAQLATVSTATNAAAIAATLEADDQRSTEKILKDIEDQLVTGGIKAILDTGVSSEAIAADQRGLRIGTAQYAASTLQSGVKTAYGAAAINTALKTATAIKSLPGIIGDAFLDVIGGGKSISKTNPLPVAVVAADEADDFASFGGTGRMLLGPAGAMSINDNDLVVGGTNLFGGSNGSNSQAVAQMAAAIVNAINNQTRELKADPVFGRGLTNSYYG